MTTEKQMHEFVKNEIEKITVKNEITYEEVKKYVDDLADELEHAHDCHKSPEDSCNACFEIGLAEQMALDGIKMLEAMRDVKDEEIERQIEHAILEK